MLGSTIAEVLQKLHMAEDTKYTLETAYQSCFVLQVGFDRCRGLTEVTHGRGHQVCVGDCLSTMFRDRVFDGVISVAVLHHLSTRERRLMALREISRVLAPGGRSLVTVWAKDQTKHSMTAYLKQDRKNRKIVRHATTPSECKAFLKVGINTDSVVENAIEKFDKTKSVDKLEDAGISLPVHEARTEFLQQDVFVPWKVKSKPSENAEEVFYRYYHVFEEQELIQLCSEISDISVLESYYTEGNWCIIFQKYKL